MEKRSKIQIEISTGFFHVLYPWLNSFYSVTLDLTIPMTLPKIFDESDRFSKIVNISLLLGLTCKEDFFYLFICVTRNALLHGTLDTRHRRKRKHQFAKFCSFISCLVSFFFHIYQSVFRLKSNSNTLVRSNMSRRRTILPCIHMHAR